MPSIHYLNPPPNPFWDFVAGLEDHPFFAGQGRLPTYASRENVGQPEVAEASGSGENRDNQPTAEDPPEVDPATLNNNADEPQNAEGLRGGPWHGRGRFANAFEGSDEQSRRGHGCPGRGGFEGRSGPHHHHRGGPMGPPPFVFGRGPWWARHVPGMDSDEHPHPHEDPHHGPGSHHRGPPGGRHGRGGWGRRHSPGGHPQGPPEGFNLGEFLNNLGNRLGGDLSGAAEGLGLDRFTGPRANAESDFEPHGDIFDTAEQYIIHLSLPGAKKEDLGVDWDGENSVLRIAGVVHRPGADEEMLSHLVVDQRKREVGVFEKNIRLGTKRDSASIDIAGINAKMTDGVLVVRVPKIEVEHKKREVPISGSSPARQEKEKESLLDEADEQMYDAASAPAPAAAVGGVSEKEQNTEYAHEQDARSETLDVEHSSEKLPEYAEATNEMSDWEKDGSEDEGEYVKINVD
jgi:HSP20 family protein